MTRVSHREVCGVCHRATCACPGGGLLRVKPIEEDDRYSCCDACGGSGVTTHVRTVAEGEEAQLPEERLCTTCIGSTGAVLRRDVLQRLARALAQATADGEVGAVRHPLAAELLRLLDGKPKPRDGCG